MARALLLAGMLSMPAWVFAQTGDALPAAGAASAAVTGTPLRRAQPGPACREIDQRGVSGEGGNEAVRLRVVVGADGRSQAVELQRSSGNASLDQAVIDAYTKCVFEPAVDPLGKPVVSTQRFDVKVRPWHEVFYPWRGIAVPPESFPETTAVKEIPITGKSAISSDERAVVMQKLRATARRLAGCASIESLEVGSSQEAPPPNDHFTRVVEEHWTLRQCGYVRHYEVSWLTYRDRSENSMVSARATNGRFQEVVLPALQGAPAVYESQVRDEYERLVAVDGPTEYLVRHIMLKTRADAEAVLARLHGGEVFATLAAEQSKDPDTRGRGGELGWRLPSGLSWQMRKAVTALGTPALVPAPLQGAAGWHVVELVQTRPRPGGLPPYEAAREAIAAHLRERQRATP